MLNFHFERKYHFVKSGKSVFSSVFCNSTDNTKWEWLGDKQDGMILEYTEVVRGTEDVI